MTKDILPQSLGKSREEQLALIQMLSETAKEKYSLPTIMDVATGMALEFARSRTRLLNDKLTLSQEMFNGLSLTVGVFTEDSLCLSFKETTQERCGVVAVRRLPSFPPIHHLVEKAVKQRDGARELH
jgi:hypothetical protein